jgi:hypothetical protein
MAALVTGCSAGSETEPPKEPNSSEPAAQDHARGKAKCVDPQRSETGFRELRGVPPDDGELWALIFGNYPARQDREIKIAWRMTGDGPLTLHATGPRGRRVAPLWGPEEHAGSNWDRPGDEWGSGWRFPQPGCWTVHLVRGSDQGTAGIRVTR